MRIAIPVKDDLVFSPLGGAEAFHFYEDDHGRITRQFLVPLERSGTDGAIELLERYGIDALICGRTDEDERRAVSSAGLMLFPNASGAADEAALAFLSGTVVFDPNNSCRACGHAHACSMDCKSCSLHGSEK